MKPESYRLLHQILELDEAPRLEIVRVLLDSLAESDTTDREWLEDARKRYESVRARLAIPEDGQPGPQPSE